MSFDWMQNNDPAGSSFGTIGSTDASAMADNSGGLNVFGSTDASQQADQSGGYAVQSAISDPSLMQKLSGYAKNLYQDKNGNIDFGKVAGILGGVYGAATYNKGLQGGEGAGYQGGIPQLYAGRNMITAPPTMVNGVARRPGQGGINYGGDVTYFNTKAEVDAQKAAADAAAAAAAAKAGVTTNTDLTGSKTDTKTDTKTDNKTNTVVTPANLGSAGYQAAIAAGMTPTQYLDNINKWISDHPNLTTKELNDALDTFKVTQTDLQTALGQNKNLSAADIYALSHGMGLKEANAQQTSGIQDWIAKNPYATAAQIKEAIKGSGVNTTDINEALTGTNLSGAYKSALTEGMGVDQLYKNILDYQVSGYTPEQIAAAKDLYKVSDADIAAAQKFATEQKYTPKVQAAVPEHSLEDSIKAILAEQKTLSNSNVDKNLESLGLTLPPAAVDTAVETPNYNPTYEDFSYSSFADGGMAKGRYLQGETDGMADELPAQIGQDQPAALSHGEFVVPADVVSHLGNGNSDAGAKKLYQMMDKIRMARTGNKKQGKKINPDKFMPGGLATYAKGGSVKHFVAGGSTPATNVNAGITGIESNLSNWAGPYVTNMLGQGQALANMPYQAYTGPLTAGASDLQTSAFKAAGDMSTPSAMTNAATNMGNIGQAASDLSYTPTTYTNQFNAPAAGTATNFTNQYSAPTGYTPTTSAFDSNQLQSYMNPYLDKILTPQLEEARRQSQITQQQNAGKMTAAGAFGGGRQAILDAETQRNLGTTQAGITGQGYNTAFTNAQQQFNADQNRKMQEAQFGSTQGMNAAQLQAQYGLSAQQANEMARQFGSQQAMTAAQQQAQYGQAANQATEASKQFGANYGLQGLQTGLQAATAQGNLGAQTGQLGLQQLAQQMAAGQTQRDIESQGIAADMAQFEEARNNPFKMIQFQQSLLQGLPTSAQAYNTTGSNALSGFAQGATTLSQIMDAINGKKPA